MSNTPNELKYTKDHEWVKIEGNVATVGITDYAQGELGDIVFVEVETEGEDPYGKGWMIKIEFSGEPEGELLSDSEYSDLIA